MPLGAHYRQGTLWQTSQPLESSIYAVHLKVTSVFQLTAPAVFCSRERCVKSYSKHALLERSDEIRRRRRQILCILLSCQNPGSLEFVNIGVLQSGPFTECIATQLKQHASLSVVFNSLLRQQRLVQVAHASVSTAQSLLYPGLQGFLASLLRQTHKVLVPCHKLMNCSIGCDGCTFRASWSQRR